VLIDLFFSSFPLFISCLSFSFEGEEDEDEDEEEDEEEEEEEEEEDEEDEEEGEDKKEPGLQLSRAERRKLKKSQGPKQDDIVQQEEQEGEEEDPAFINPNRVTKQMDISPAQPSRRER
jgi:hypothetical protein